MRVPNVQRSRLLKLVMSVSTLCLDYLHDLLTSNGNLTSHGIFRSNYILAKTVQDRLVVALGNIGEGEGGLSSLQLPFKMVKQI